MAFDFSHARVTSVDRSRFPKRKINVWFRATGFGKPIRKMGVEPRRVILGARGGGSGSTLPQARLQGRV